MKTDAEALRAVRGDERRAVAHGEHSIEGSAGAQRFDIALFGNRLKAQRRGAIAPGIFEDMAAVRGQDQVHAQPFRRAEEFGHLVAGLGGHQ